MQKLLQKPLVALALLWLLAVLLAWPVGDFPLDDDWSYAEVVMHWVETGEYQVSDWPAMTLFSQVIWGGLFVKIFGFSFYTLRLSTLVLAVAGLLAFRQIMVRLELPRFWQLIALLTLVFNPVFFELSLTFMTDVPFLSLMAMSLYAYLRAFEKEELKWWATATLLSSLAILLRQPALLIPAAMGIAGIIGKPGWRRLWLAICSTGLVYLTLQSYIFWQESTPSGLPGAFSQPGSIRYMLDPGNFVSGIKNIGGLYLMYTGFMLLPALLLTNFKPRQKSEWLLAGFLTAVSLLLISLAWDQGLLGNTLHKRGLGTIPLPGVPSDGHWPTLPAWLELPAKILSVTGILLLSSHGSIRIHRLVKQYSRFCQGKGAALNPAQTLRLGLMGFLFPYCLFLLVNYIQFDRYLLPVLLSGLILIRPGGQIRKTNQATTGLLLFFIALFSVAGTHDYFAWNRARWAAIHAAMDSGVPSDQIDGGFEFNGWYRTGPKRPSLPYSKSWWFVAEDTYAVSFGPFSNFKPVAIYPFRRYLPPGQDSIYLLKRPDWNRRDTLFYAMEPGQWPEDNPFAQLRQSEKVSLVPESYNHTHAYKMPPKQEYGLTHRLFPVAPYDEIEFSLWTKQGAGLLKLVFSAPDANDFHYSRKLYRSPPFSGGWQLHEGNFRIPEAFPSDTLSLYFWKRPQDSIFMDDFRIIWKQTSTR
jgi:4-amino-4-deoxy-L-arabinose transferase-like glycosyltransferase